MRNSLRWMVTVGDVMSDLDVGRGGVTRPPDRLLRLPSRRRPTIGGPLFVTTYLTAHALGRLHPKLASRPLMRLWLTPWVHRSTRRPVTDLTADLLPWSQTHEGRRMRGFVGGDGPTVVLVHGWAGRAADWRHLAADLIAAGWRVVAPDLPAHGATAGRRTDAFELGHAAAAVLRHEQPQAIVAHSMGFPIVMIAFDEGVRPPPTLVALAPGRRMSRALERFAAQVRLPAPLIAELDRANRRRFGDDVWDVLDVDPLLVELTPRGLVVQDTDDEDVPTADARHIADHWPGATLVTTSGLGHRRILRDQQVRARVIDVLQADARTQQ